MTTSQFDQQVWLVTGASGGLGSAFAEAALLAGHSVLCAARKAEAVMPLISRYPNLAYPLTFDVTDSSAVMRAVHEGVEHFGRLDVVVNNAGAGVFGAVEELELNQIEKLFALNVLGPFNVLKATLPVLRKQRSGHVINISSMSGIVGDAGTGAYNITKFALEGMSEALAAELKPLGIHVTIVEPGPFKTDFGKAANQGPDTAAIADYSETSGKLSGMLKDLSSWANGDPKLAGEALVKLAGSNNPPLRLVLGSIAFDAVSKKIDQVRTDLETWKAVSQSTDRQQAITPPPAS